MAQVREFLGYGNIFYRKSYYRIRQCDYYADLSSGDYELVCQCDASRSDPVLKSAGVADGAVRPPVSEAYREICVFHGNRLFASDRYYRDSVDLQIDRSADSVYLVHQKRFFEKSINQDGPEAARPFACIYEHKGAS